MQVMVLQDNNPDMLFFLVLILIVFFVVSGLVEIKIKIKRLKNLENLKEKLQEIHDSIIY